MHDRSIGPDRRCSGKIVGFEVTGVILVLETPKANRKVLIPTRGKYMYSRASHPYLLDSLYWTASSDKMTAYEKQGKQPRRGLSIPAKLF